MALTRLGGGVVQMSGSIGGTTFARNRYGNYARARTSPVNPNSAYQQTARTAMSTAAAAWLDDLSEAQREAFRSYAAAVPMKNRLGETIYLTGQNHFVRINSFRQQLGLALITAAPVIHQLGEKDNLFDATASVASQEISVVFDDLDAFYEGTGARMVVYMGRPQDASVNFFNGPYRLAGSIVGNDPAEVSPYGIAVPFPIALGQKVWVRARKLHADGRLSEIQTVSCVVGA